MARIRLVVFLQSRDGTVRDGTPTKNLYLVRFNRERVASIDETIGLGLVRDDGGLGRDRCRAISIGGVVDAVFARLRLRRLVRVVRVSSLSSSVVVVDDETPTPTPTPTRNQSLHPTIPSRPNPTRRDGLVVFSLPLRLAGSTSTARLAHPPLSRSSTRAPVVTPTPRAWRLPLSP